MEADPIFDYVSTGSATGMPFVRWRVALAGGVAGVVVGEDRACLLCKIRSRRSGGK